MLDIIRYCFRMNLARRRERPTMLLPAQAQWTGVPPTFGHLQFIYQLFTKTALG